MGTKTITTLAERKQAEARRRSRAAEQAVEALRAYARETGGRFVVFGSFVTNGLRYDSDLDVMVDFPASASLDAWLFAEDVGQRLDLPIDLHDAGTSKAAFVERVLARGVLLE